MAFAKHRKATYSWLNVLGPAKRETWVSVSVVRGCGDQAPQSVRAAAFELFDRTTPEGELSLLGATPLGANPANIDVTLQVPDVVGENKALTNLGLSGNSLKGLPDTINSLSELVHLNLSNNKLKSLPIRPIGRKEKGPRLASLETLRLENNRLSEGPAAVETFSTLTDLK